VSFDVWWRVPSFWSDTLAPDYSPNPADPRLGLTDSDADLLTASREARQAGLNVTLTPKFLIGPTPSLSGSTWRGDYRPPHPATFFAQYQAMVDHYADLGRQAGMSTFFVGSEMSNSIDFVDEWRQIASSARQHFGGPIGYEVDWRQPAQFSWGDAVDVIALSAYFPLSNASHPTLQQLEAGWTSYKYPGQSEEQDAFSSVAALAQRWGKPITFGDVGYRATAYPARAPSENAHQPADPKEQYLAYRALLNTFAGQSWWGGVTWWAWNEGSQPSPESKPAEKLISAQCVIGDAGATAGAQGTAERPCPSTTAAAAGTPNGAARLPAELALGTFILALLTMVGAGVLLRSAVRRAARAQAISPTMPFPVTNVTPEFQEVSGTS
jgi:hypothetical protein